LPNREKLGGFLADFPSEYDCCDAYSTAIIMAMIISAPALIIRVGVVDVSAFVAILDLRRNCLISG
jgi:hypothetical protein